MAYLLARKCLACNTGGIPLHAHSFTNVPRGGLQFIIIYNNDHFHSFQQNDKVNVFDILCLKVFKDRINEECFIFCWKILLV